MADGDAKKTPEALHASMKTHGVMALLLGVIALGNLGYFVYTALRSEGEAKPLLIPPAMMCLAIMTLQLSRRSAIAKDLRALESGDTTPTGDDT